MLLVSDFFPDLPSPKRVKARRNHRRTSSLDPAERKHRMYIPWTITNTFSCRSLSLSIPPSVPAPLFPHRTACNRYDATTAAAAAEGENSRCSVGGACQGKPLGTGQVGPESCETSPVGEGALVLFKILGLDLREEGLRQA